MAPAEMESAVTTANFEELIAHGLEPLHETLRRMEGLLSQLASEASNSSETTKELLLACRARNDSRPDGAPFVPAQTQVPVSRAPSALGERAEARSSMSSTSRCEAGEPEPSRREIAVSEKTRTSEAEAQPEPGTLRRTRELDIRSITRDVKHENGRSRFAQQALSLMARLYASVHGLQEPVRKGILDRIIKSTRFENLCAFVILVNSLFVAYTSDFDMKHPGQNPGMAVKVLEISFFTYYFVELVLRLLNHRLFFFINEDMKWNIFDFILVALSVVDATVAYVVTDSGSEGANMSFMRLLRLLKLAKILRTLRVIKVFRDLAQIVESFRNCIISLFWSCFMLLFVIFLFSLVFIQGLAGYIAENGEVDDLDEIKDKFGSVGGSMLTLYMAVTGGDDWVGMYRVVEKAGPFYGMSFAFFIFFAVFALFNILTGVFVEKAVCAAQPEREEIIIEQRRKTMEDAAEFRHICEVLDEDKTGSISRAEFNASMENDLMESYMSARGLQVRDVDVFFELMVAKQGSRGGLDNGEVQVRIDDFVDGCMAMRGMATSFDIAKFRFEVQAEQRSMRDIVDTNAYNLQQMASDLRRLETLIRDGRALQDVGGTQVSTPRVAGVRAGIEAL